MKFYVLWTNFSDLARISLYDLLKIGMSVFSMRLKRQFRSLPFIQSLLRSFHPNLPDLIPNEKRIQCDFNLFLYNIYNYINIQIIK